MVKWLVISIVVVGVFACFAAREKPAHEEELVLVWQVGKEGMWESDWIKEALSGVSFTEVQDEHWEVFKDRCIVVVSNQKQSKQKRYFNKLHKMKCRFGVIQLSDELYSIKDTVYPHAAFVLRHYWHKNCQGNICAFPLGYKRGFWSDCPEKKILEASQRKYTWSFAGQIEKSTRLEMISNMRKVPRHHVHEINGFGAANSLGTPDYRALLLDTIFVPCPRGFWNLDSFRVYEALECGCIPIVEKTPIDYFSRFLGEHPFLTVTSWDEVPSLLNHLLERPEELEARRLECAQWWLDYKDTMKQQIATLINTKLSQKSTKP